MLDAALQLLLQAAHAPRNGISFEELFAYVDDFRIIIQMLDQGTRWDGEKLVWNPLWEEEDIASGESRERITATELCKVMNSICKDVKMTVEVEEDFTSKFIPTLDMQIKLDKDLGRLVYKFYSKPMSSSLCLVEKSALPITIRNATLTQEVLRRQLNCSRDVGTKERMEILELFTIKMTKSGYSKSQMRDALTSGLLGYANRVEREERLGIPVHRDGASGKPLRRLDKLTAKSTWFKRPRVEQELPESPTKRRRTGTQQRGETGSEYPIKTPDTVMFVPKTRGGTLASLLKTQEKELSPYINNSVRIMEEAGSKLVHVLTKADPFKGPCERAKCSICPGNDKMAGKCYTRNVTYTSSCMICKSRGVVSKYIGETSRSLLERELEHRADALGKKSTSHRRIHLETTHPELTGRDPNSLFQGEITKTHDPPSRG